MMEILLMCSLLCSSDVIAAVTIIDSKKQPKLASILFGEGVTNDAVSIILFNAVLKQSKKAFTPATPMLIMGDFLSLAFFSLLMGIGMALLVALLFKH